MLCVAVVFLLSHLEGVWWGEGVGDPRQAMEVQGAKLRTCPGLLLLAWPVRGGAVQVALHVPIWDGTL